MQEDSLLMAKDGYRLETSAYMVYLKLLLSLNPATRCQRRSVRLCCANPSRQSYNQPLENGGQIDFDIAKNMLVWLMQAHWLICR
jgi:hypothetical protein